MVAQSIVAAASIDPDMLDRLVNEEDAAIVASLRRRTGRTPPPSPSSAAARQFDLEAELAIALAAQAAAAASGAEAAAKGALVLGEGYLAAAAAETDDAAGAAGAGVAGAVGAGAAGGDDKVEHANNLELAMRWVQARRVRDFTAADQIRTLLRAKGVEPEVPLALTPTLALTLALTLTLALALALALALTLALTLALALTRRVAAHMQRVVPRPHAHRRAAELLRRRQRGAARPSRPLTARWLRRYVSQVGIRDDAAILTYFD